MVGKKRITIDILTITTLVLIIYIVTNAKISLYNQLVVPRGDPFTYTINWLNVIFDSEKNNYFIELKNNLFPPTSWYAFQTLLIGVFSPILSPNPVSISLINFFLVLITCMSIYFALSKISSSIYAPIFASILYLSMPWHYGTHVDISLYTLQLDTALINLLFSASFIFLTLMLDQNPSIYIMILMGINAGFVIWSRANSLPIIFICTLPILFSTILWKKYSGELNIYKTIKILTIPTLIFLLMAYDYYSHFFSIIVNYYKPLMSTSKGIFLPNLILKQLLLVPGIFFVGDLAKNTTVTSLSLFSHSIMISSFLYTLASIFRKKIFNKTHVILLSGCLIYFSVLTFFLTLFHTPDVMVYYPYAPMLVGLFFVLTILSLMMFEFIIKFIPDNFQLVWARPFLIIFVIFFTYILNENNSTIPNTHGADNPLRVSEIAMHPESFFGTGKLAFMWYEMYNAPIINYYRLLNRLPPIEFNGGAGKLSFYSNSLFTYIWDPSYNHNKDAMRKGIQLMLEEATILVVPQKIKCYHTADPYPLYREPDIIRNELKNTNFKFYIIGTLNDDGCELLVLSKSKYKTLLSDPSKDLKIFKGFK